MPGISDSFAFDQSEYASKGKYMGENPNDVELLPNNKYLNIEYTKYGDRIPTTGQMQTSTTLKSQHTAAKSPVAPKSVTPAATPVGSSVSSHTSSASADDISLANLWNSYKKSNPISAGAANGVWNFAVSTVKASLEMFLDPAQYAIGVGKMSLATTPGLSSLFPGIKNEMLQGFYQAGVGMVNKFKTGDAYTRSSMVTEAGLTIASMFIGVGEAKAGITASRAAATESTALLSLTEETFSQALFKGAEKAGGYSIYGTKGLTGNSFNRNIFLLEASGGKSLSGFRSLIGTLETEALNAGANKISIYGSSVINKGFLNPNIAKRFGYSFEQSGSGVFLQKFLK